MSDEITEFLRAEALRNRGLDELDIPTDIVELLAEFGFETVDDIFNADPNNIPVEAVSALSLAFGGEGVQWTTPANAPGEANDSAIEAAVTALLDTYRAFHPAESWPEEPFTLFRADEDLELHLTDGSIVRGRLSAPLLLAASYRAAAVDPELVAAFGRLVSFPKDPLLEDQIGLELLAAAHAFLEDGLEEEAILLARRALRDVRWIRSDDFPAANDDLTIDDVDPRIRDEVAAATEIASLLENGDLTHPDAPDVVRDCAESPDPLDRYETAIALRSIFEEMPTDMLAEICDNYFETLHRLATDESDAVCERALHAIYVVGHKLWEHRDYRNAQVWLELALDGGVYPGETMRRLAECRLYVDGEIPESLEERLQVLSKIDVDAYRGPWFDEWWREDAHVSVAETLATRGKLPRARECAKTALESLKGEDRRTLNLRGRALLVLGDCESASGKLDGARAVWKRAREAFESAKLTAHASDVSRRLLST